MALGRPKSRIISMSGVTQQLLHDGHRKDIPTQTEGRELGTAAQNRQGGLKLGLCDPTLL